MQYADESGVIDFRTLCHVVKNRALCYETRIQQRGNVWHFGSMRTDGDANSSWLVAEP
jgi:hypothetical protein